MKVGRNMRYGGSPTIEAALLRRIIEHRGLDLTTIVHRVARAEGRTPERADPIFRRLAPDAGRLSLQIADRIITHGLGDPALWHTVPELAAIYEAE